MNLVSESIVLLFFGSIFLGPKKAVKLAGDLARLKAKLMTAQAEIKEQLKAEAAAIERIVDQEERPSQTQLDVTP